jgi:hypothetical protein
MSSRNIIREKANGVPVSVRPVNDRAGVKSQAEHLATYMLHGHGIGLSVAVPGQPFSPKLRALPLDGFKPLELGVLWYGTLNALENALLEEIQRRAASLKT